MLRPRITARTSVLAATLVAFTIALAGCGSSGDDEATSTSGATASAEYCTALAATVTEAEKLATIVAGEPVVDEIHAQHNELKVAYATIGETNSNTKGGLEQTVARAYAEFDTAIAQLPTDIPASELAIEYREQTGSLLNSLADVQSEAGC